MTQNCDTYFSNLTKHELSYNIECTELWPATQYNIVELTGLKRWPIERR